MRLVMCGPYPVDDAEQKTGDGLMQAVVTLAHALHGIGVKVEVLSRSTKLDKDRTSTVKGLPVTWVSDPWARADYLISRRLLRARFAEQLKALNPTIVHAHGEAPYIRSALDATVPSVITLHSIFSQQTRAHGAGIPLQMRFAYFMMRRWESHYIRRITDLIAINSQIADYVSLKAPRVRIHRVNNAVDARLFSVSNKEDRPTILFIGQASRRKGLHVLMEAFSKIADAHPLAVLRVVGDFQQDPAYRAELFARFRPLFSANRVEMAGPCDRDGIADELARCSFLCLASTYEASPLVVIEAMAAGKPVIATRVGDTDELLEQGKCGRLVPVGDSTVMSIEIDKLLRSSDLRREIGQRARVSAHSRAEPRIIAEKTLGVYRTVLSSPR